MTRWWSFFRLAQGGRTEERIGPEHVKVGGSLDESLGFGPMLLFPPGEGPNAVAKVFSNETGQTYWVSTQAPGAILTPGATIGNAASMHQFQVYRKRDSNATLHLVVSKAFLEGLDGNPGPPTALECPWHDALKPYTDCRRIMMASVDYDVTAFSYFDQKTILKTGGAAELTGFRAFWDFKAYTTYGANASFWGNQHFAFDSDEDGDGGGHATLTLAAPITINVPLDSVGVGNDFYLSVVVKASAYNHRQRESYLSAYFRDPVGADGLEVVYSGIDPVETPTEKPVEPVLVSAPECTGGSGGGVLQFGSPTFETPELPGAGATVLITRTGSTAGAVSATLTTSDGAATAGSDYSAVSTIVLFADGEGGTRGIRIPILSDDTAEPDKALNLTLSAPKGCASLGALSSATLTILDDDRPIVAPETYAVGGTVTGLAGTGLVLTNAGINLMPGGNGPFVFGLEYISGLPYDVRVTTQPTNPDQVCTVSNGRGTIADHDISDVLVTCVTQAPNGSLDPAYGVAGKVTSTTLGGAIATALQPDGKTVVVGGQYVARFNTDGTPDNTFGGTGSVTVTFNGGLNDQLQGLAIQPDGKIVVVGYANVGTQNDFAIARLTPTGALDASFGSGGKVTTDFNGQVDEAWAALIQSDGAIVVAGHAGTFTPLGVDNDFAVARYTSAGTLDPSFGGGKVTTNIGGRTDLAYAAALQSDGKILVTGRVANGGGDDPDVGIVRYGTDGTPDAGFGTQGIVRRDLSGNWDEASDLAIQSDGKILVSVQAVVGSTFDFEVARFTVDGSLDGSFGSNGLASVGFGTLNDFVKGLALQADGKIVVAGSAGLASTDFGVARLQSNGTLDAGFGNGGKLTVDFFAASDGAQSLVVQADGRIVVAGGAANGTQFRLALVRILP
jgi:uncharacterized delta-60 repeat protein